MSNKNSEIVVFFDEIHRMISKYGLKKVLYKIREIPREEKPVSNEVLAEYIIEISSDIYGVETDSVKYTRKRGDVADARLMCFALMKEHIKDISYEGIGLYFGGRSRQYVTRVVSDLPLNQDNFSTKMEEKFVEDFILLSKKVHEFKMSCE
jgi:chromosomal replication initiation ATPase DnaA